MNAPGSLCDVFMFSYVSCGNRFADKFPTRNLIAGLASSSQYFSLEVSFELEEV